MVAAEGYERVAALFAVTHAKALAVLPLSGQMLASEYRLGRIPWYHKENNFGASVVAQLVDIPYGSAGLNPSCSASDLTSC